MAVQPCRVNEELPKVPLQQGGTGLSLAFVFVALLETMTVNNMRQKHSKAGKTRVDDPDAEYLNSESNLKWRGWWSRSWKSREKGTKQVLLPSKNSVEKLLSKTGVSKHMVMVTWIVFPLTFLFFLINCFGVYYSSYVKYSHALEVLSCLNLNMRRTFWFQKFNITWANK